MGATLETVRQERKNLQVGLGDLLNSCPDPVAFSLSNSAPVFEPDGGLVRKIWRSTRRILGRYLKF